MDLVVALNDAHNAGDLDRWIEFYAPDVEVIPDASAFPESSPFRGRDQLRSWLEDVRITLVGERWEIVEMQPVGAEHILVRYEWSGMGAASGIKASSGITAIHAVRDGRIARSEFYFDHEQALRAAGINM